MFADILDQFSADVYETENEASHASVLSQNHSNGRCDLW